MDYSVYVGRFSYVMLILFDYKERIKIACFTLFFTLLRVYKNFTRYIKNGNVTKNSLYITLYRDQNCLIISFHSNL